MDDQRPDDRRRADDQADEGRSRPADTDPRTAPFVDPSSRDRVTVIGPDAESYLHSQVAQDVVAMAVGEMRWTFVLDPSGKVVVLARLTRTASDHFELDTDAGFGPVLLERLQRFKIRVDADLELHPAELDAPRPDVEAARIAAGWPRMGAEIVPGETIPGVTGVTPLAVSFTKGCYPGQELVERMDSRGAEAPRSLRIVQVGPGAAAGDAVLDDEGNEVGSLTSVAGSIAIAIVKRGAAPGHFPPHAG